MKKCALDVIKEMTQRVLETLNTSCEIDNTKTADVNKEDIPENTDTSSTETSAT